MPDYWTGYWRRLEGIPYRYAEMRPCDRILSVLKRLSYRRVIWKAEAEKIAKRMAKKISKRPTLTVKAFFGDWYGDYWFCNGEKRLLEPIDWEALEQEARKDGVQFCPFYKRREKFRNRVYQMEAEWSKTRRVINQLKKVIKDEDRNSEHRTTA